MPGAVFFILLNCWTISSTENGSFRTSFPQRYHHLLGETATLGWGSTG